MATIIYDSKSIIPAPFVTINRDFDRSGDGEVLSPRYTFTLNGTIVAYKGSPNSSGVFHTLSGYPADESIPSDERLKSILKKQEAILELFAVEGRVFEIQPLDGSPPTKCNPRNIVVNFAEGIWHDRCDYTITFEADRLYPIDDSDFNYYIQSANESWQIEANEDLADLDHPVGYRVTHTLNSLGKRFYDDAGILQKEAWEEARDWCLDNGGLDNSIIYGSGSNIPTYFNAYNYIKNTDLDEKAGTYSLSETWIFHSGNAIETFEIQTQRQSESNVSIVSINGTITGLFDSSTKYENAQAKFVTASGLVFSRCQNFSGLTLNTVKRSETIGRNPITGVITYAYEFDDTSSNIVPGTIVENISINDSLEGQAFAPIFILGRPNGPILQDLGTIPELKRTLNIDLVMEGKTNFGSNTVNDIKNAFFSQNPRLAPTTSGLLNNIIEAANPANNGFTTVFKSPPTETWNPKEGSYNYSIEWTFNKDT